MTKNIEVKPKAVQFKDMVESLNDKVEQTYYLEQKVYEWNKKIKANKLDISKAIGSKKRLQVRVDEANSFEVQKETNIEISFFEDQLKKALDKTVYNRIVERTVVIKDLKGLTKLLKDNGIKPKEFKSYLQMNDKADVELIEQMLDMGEIEIKDLQGCFSTNFDEEIKVRKSK